MTPDQMVNASHMRFPYHKGEGQGWGGVESIPLGILCIPSTRSPTPGPYHKGGGEAPA